VEHRNDGRPRHQFAHDLQALLSQRSHDQRRAGGIAAWAAVAGNKAATGRVNANDEHDGNRGGRGLGRERGWGSLREDYVDRPPGQLRRHHWQTIVLAIRPAVFNRNVLAKHKTILA
jgi:hypothetical protein